MTSLNFGCPVCGVRPGMFCVGPQRRFREDPIVRDSHRERMDLARVFERAPSRGFTLYQIWSWVIAHGGLLAKRIENRDYPPPESIIGKRLAIHAGLTVDLDAMDYLTVEAGYFAALLDRSKRGKVTVKALRVRADADGTMHPWVPLVTGAVESVVTVAGAIHESGKHVGFSAGITEATKTELLRDPYFSGSWGWVLADVVTLAKPVPVMGALGLWDLDREPPPRKGEPPRAPKQPHERVSALIAEQLRDMREGTVNHG